MLLHQTPNAMNSKALKTPIKPSSLQITPKYLKEELEECQNMILGKFKKDLRKRLHIQNILSTSPRPKNISVTNSVYSIYNSN